MQKQVPQKVWLISQWRVRQPLKALSQTTATTIVTTYRPATLEAMEFRLLLPIVLYVDRAVYDYRPFDQYKPMAWR
jgi:hypothetical protein